jgi:hypothetical protein
MNKAELIGGALVAAAGLYVLFGGPLPSQLSSLTSFGGNGFGTYGYAGIGIGGILLVVGATTAWRGAMAPTTRKMTGPVMMPYPMMTPQMMFSNPGMFAGSDSARPGAGWSMAPGPAGPSPAPGGATPPPSMTGPPAGPAATAAPGDYRFCPSCGQKNLASARYCQKCGATVPVLPT